MKRIICVIVLICLLLPFGILMSGCDTTSTGNDGRVIVIASMFPQYDFIRQIAGDRVNLSMLISPGAESHSFNPSPQDIIALSRADLFIYNGGHVEDWVGRVLYIARDENPDINTASMLQIVRNARRNYYEGNVCICDECSAGFCEDCGEHHACTNHDCSCAEHPESILDEHVWTSPRNAVHVVRAIADTLSELDPNNADYFQENALSYIAELEELGQAFMEVANSGERNTVIFGDRFPVGNLMRDLGLTHFAAFPGCSAETGADPATIAALITRINNENIPVVFHIELSNRTIAHTIAEETGTRMLEFHSLHNVSPADFSARVTYVEVMMRNLENLREALN